MGGQIVFISYDGSYPNLCSGTLKFKAGNEEFSWDHCLSSGGAVLFDDEWMEHISAGEWRVDFPDNFPEILRPAVVDMVNANVPLGCCGGCV
ncbi:hypothetical protein LJC46_08260 [Desulfovibrio sp. OttesenSCG-928-G15]|nr:hypothetical protein [Desulfovibrio sp. OttesenSCG-928-G15]